MSSTKKGVATDVGKLYWLLTTDSEPYAEILDYCPTKDFIWNWMRSYEIDTAWLSIMSDVSVTRSIFEFHLKTLGVLDLFDLNERAIACGFDEKIGVEV